jgi:hypothetical protein
MRPLRITRLQAFDAIDVMAISDRSILDAAVKKVGCVQAMADRIRDELGRILPQKIVSEGRGMSDRSSSAGEGGSFVSFGRTANTRRAETIGPARSPSRRPAGVPRSRGCPDAAVRAAGGPFPISVVAINDRTFRWALEKTLPENAAGLPQRNLDSGAQLWIRSHL